MHRRIRLVAGAVSLTVAGALAATPTAANAAPTVEAIAHTAGADLAHSCSITLPGNLKVQITDQDGVETPLVLGANAHTASLVELTLHGDTVVVPETALRSAFADGFASYDTTRLAAQDCGFAAPAAASVDSADSGNAAGGRPGSGADGGYTLGRLTVHTLDSSGDPAPEFIVLSNMDDTGEALQLLRTDATGTLKIAVPDGHYDALLFDGDGELAGQGTFVLDNDFTVEDGTSITLDERTATVSVPTPSTPRPADLTSSGLNLAAGTGGGYGKSYGELINFLNLGSTPSSYRINPTAAPKQGNFFLDAAFEFESPAGTAKPYSYHIDEVYNHVPDSFPTKVQPSSLATVKRDYGAPGAAGTAVVAVQADPLWLAKTAFFPLLNVNEDLPTGASRTEYFSTAPGLVWQTILQDLTDGNESVTENTYLPGTSSIENFDTGALHPSIERDAGAGMICGACSKNGELLFGVLPFGDNTPGHAGEDVNGTEADNVSVYRDGALLAQGDTNLELVSVAVPAGSATYRVQQTTTRSVPGVTLSDRSQTTWTFTADPGHGPEIPSDWVCADGTTSCNTVPMLTAYYNTDSNLLNQLTPGRHTMDLTVLQQQDTDAPVVAGAEISVSYDGGSTWQTLHTTGAHGDYQGAFTVPASAEGGYVSVRVRAWDGAGNRIDQTVTDAYQVH